MLLCVFSCRKDQIEDDLSIFTPPVAEEFATEIRGTVFDRNLKRITQTTVTVGNEVTVTDEYGHFIIQGSSASEDGSLMTFDHPEYFKNYKFVYPTVGGASNVQVLMNPRMGFLEFEASQGGQPRTELSFPPNAIVDENGDPYNGKVRVYSFYMNTDAPNFNYQIPGDLRAEDIDGNQVQLGTFGMWTVELETPDGLPLQLGNGQKASLDFRVASDLLDSAPPEIPLWHFEKSTGVWIEEGMATLEGGIYRAEVSHFSTWNCDIPFPTCKLQAKFVDNNGKPLANYAVKIEEATGLLVTSTITNSLGVISGPVPTNTNVKITILNSCGQDIYSESHEINENNCNLGEIEVEPSVDLILLTGQLLNCDGQPLTNGFAVLQIDDIKDQIVYPDKNGNISELIDNCDKNELNIKVVDFENIQSSNYIEVALSSPTDFGVIGTCTSLSDEYLTLKTNNLETLAFDETFEAFILDGSEIIILGGNDDPTSFVLASIPLLDKGEVAPVFFSSLQENISGTSRFSCDCYDDGGTTSYPCENNMIAKIMEYDGETVIGNISGYGRNEDQTENVEINMNFKVKLGDPLNRVNISGKTWLDINENGIQDDQLNDPIKIETGFSTYLAFDSYPMQFPDVIENYNDDGTYNIQNAVVNDRFEVVLRFPLNYQATLRNQGTDDTKDNDFESLSSGATYRQFSTSLQNGLQKDLSAVDAGLIDYQNELVANATVYGCGVTAAVVLEVNGGTPPYSYDLPTGVVLEQGGALRNLATGIYNINIEDSNGLKTQVSWTIPQQTNKIIINAFVDKNGNSNYDETIDEKLKDVVFNLSAEEMFPMEYVFVKIIDSDPNENGNYIFSLVPWHLSPLKLEVETPPGYEILETGIGDPATANDFEIPSNDPNAFPLINLTVQECDGTWEFFAGFKEL